MARGTVRWFNGEKVTVSKPQTRVVGISSIHYSGIAGSGFRSLEECERVIFEPSRGRKGEQAENPCRVDWGGTLILLRSGPLLYVLTTARRSPPRAVAGTWLF
jgi:CspA family cold shock protein